MNRLILIGNGFDLAHGLKTSYTDFMIDFWEQKTRLFLEEFRQHEMLHQGTIPHKNYEDDDILIESIDFYTILQDVPIEHITVFYGEHRHSLFFKLNLRKDVDKVHFKNNFFKQITEKQQLHNWVDIEEEYYTTLVDCINKDVKNIQKLNEDFKQILNALEIYLLEQSKIDLIKNQNISSQMFSPVSGEIYHGVYNPEYCPENILFLNFNYTRIIDLYTRDTDRFKIVNIHGELNNIENPIIFGYGDELDEKYKSIEQLNINEYLVNIKSIKYAQTRKYKELLAFVDSSEYQVFIMGHSCGISDRTLLNKIFQHTNCKLIKPFFHVKDGYDNYTDISINISRNFTDKSLFREILVNKLDCEPLPQIMKEV